MQRHRLKRIYAYAQIQKAHEIHPVINLILDLIVRQIIIGILRDKIKILAKKREPKIYEYGFLK
jgi:hypothetical protein